MNDSRPPMVTHSQSYHQLHRIFFAGVLLFAMLTTVICAAWFPDKIDMAPALWFILCSVILYPLFNYADSHGYHVLYQWLEYMEIISLSFFYYALNLVYNPAIILYIAAINLSALHGDLRAGISRAAVLLASFIINSWIVVTCKPWAFQPRSWLINFFIVLFSIIAILLLMRESAAIDKNYRRIFNDNLTLRRRLRIRNSALSAELKKLNEKLSRSFLSIIKALAKILEARDISTRGHSEKVTEYALHLGMAAGLDRGLMAIIADGGRFHDIGKVAIPDIILLKPGKLDDQEYEAMKTHVKIGDRILSSITGMDPRIIAICRSHHERIDGRGYPDRLTIDQLPIEVRIMGIADAFDAMTANRCYRKALPLDIAIDEINRNSGSQFDPRLAEIFVELIKKGIISPDTGDS